MSPTRSRAQGGETDESNRPGMHLGTSLSRWKVGLQERLTAPVEALRPRGGGPAAGAPDVVASYGISPAATHRWWTPATRQGAAIRAGRRASIPRPGAMACWQLAKPELLLRQMSSERIVKELCSGLASSVPEARQPGAIPRKPGFYAWWCTPDALPSVPATADLREALGLLYIGIAPRDASSSAELSSRLLGQHIGGNIGSSTFRLGLAALLWESQGWTPRISASGKPRLDRTDNLSLSRWQAGHLRLSYAVVTKPWRFESAVIQAMEPPMNRGHNADHTFYADMGAARALLRATARRGTADVPDGHEPRVPRRPSPTAHRLEFTSGQIGEIRRLLVELRRSDRDRQKSLRAKLRRLGFHISDVSHGNDGFTVSDFDALLRAARSPRPRATDESGADGG